ncbi:MAG: PIG-L deacetylase family protein [Chloroflexota bacterium]
MADSGKPAPAYALVVAAHPDDAEYGVAGTVALWSNEGCRTVYIVCTTGDKGSTDREVDAAWLKRTREREQRAAARVVGVDEVVFLGYADQALQDTAALRKDIVRVIRRWRPRVVVGPDPFRRYLWHRDHRIAGQVVLDAVFPYASSLWSYPDLLDEGLDPHLVDEVWLWGSEQPDHFCDIGATFGHKLAALHCHESQLKQRPRDQFDEWLRQRYRAMAKGQDFEFAEAFRRLRVPRLG